MKLFNHILIALVAIITCACGGAKSRATDFEIPLYTPKYASGFDIRGAEGMGSSLISIRNPWQGAKDVEQQLFIRRNEEKIPAGFEGQTIKSPLNHVVCMSSSHVAMFDILGLSKRISGVSGIDYLSSEYVAEHRLCGEVRDVGYDTNINFELLASMRPGLVLLYGVTGENTIITGKLRELEIPYIYIGDYMEQSPLGKAEWLVAIAEMCDHRVQGVELFDGVATRYESLLQGVNRDAKPPKVMLNTPYRDTWFMPSVRSYAVRLIADAGGEYLYPQNDSDSSVAVDMEQAYLLATQADVWLNLGACNTMEELRSQNPKFANISAVLSGRVYNNNRRQTAMGGSDFWESGVVHPDRVLSDLITILNNPDKASLEGLYYYKQMK